MAEITNDVIDPFNSDPLVPGGGVEQEDASQAWDVALDSLTFLLANNERWPFRRETADYRRQRLDTERSPGEQSLDSGYWLRSSTSWHLGSGIVSNEPLEIPTEEARMRYHRGGGVDPWTPGQLSLLHSTEEITTSSAAAQGVLGVTSDSALHYAGATLERIIPNVLGTAPITWGGSGNIQSLTTDGENWIAADDTGIYRGALPDGAGSVVWSYGSSTRVLTRFVKDRLVAAVDNSLYELADETGAPTLPTPLYTHPTQDWTWTDVTEAPSAIYVAGYSGEKSGIFRIEVTVDAGVITLSQPIEVAQMPRGERVNSLYTHVGAYLIVGTSKGVRVALINSSDGSISMGPVIVKSEDGVHDSVAVGSYVYVTVGSHGSAGNRADASGLYRIDLSRSLDQGPLVFPSAADVYVDPASSTAPVHSVTTVSGRLVMCSQGTGGGVWTISGTDYVPEGWFETGRVRYGTMEPKAWRSLRLVAKEDSQGAITGFASLTDSSTPSLWTQVIATADGVYDVEGSLTGVAPSAQPSMYFAVRLERHSATVSPVLMGWQVKAMPSPDRSELISVPLLMFDRETDAMGLIHGYPGYSWSRFQQLKYLEQNAAIIIWRDYTTGEAAKAVIERVAMTRLSAPVNGHSGAGGVCEVLMRLV